MSLQAVFTRSANGKFPAPLRFCFSYCNGSAHVLFLQTQTARPLRVNAGAACPQNPYPCLLQGCTIKAARHFAGSAGLCILGSINACCKNYCPQSAIFSASSFETDPTFGLLLQRLCEGLLLVQQQDIGRADQHALHSPPLPVHQPAANAAPVRVPVARSSISGFCARYAARARGNRCTVPSSGSSVRASRRSKVDFPVPLIPMIPILSPLSTSSDASFSSCLRP